MARFDTPATHQSRSERTARIFETEDWGSPNSPLEKLTVSGVILPWSGTNLCHSGGSKPTLNKEGAFEGSNLSAFKDGSFG